MKKLFLSIVCATVGISQALAQCGTPVQSVFTDFSAGIPPCWYSSGVGVTFQTAIFSTNNNGDRWMVLPMVDNAKGILEFDALNATNSQAGPGNFKFGVASATGIPAMGTFELVEELDIYYASSGGTLIFTHHVIDYSGYTGTGQYIVIWMSGAVSREVRLDNVSYESACISQSVTALAQDVTVQLNAFGNANVNPGMVDNGSTSDCGTPEISLSQSEFDCSHVGVNQVTFTADDGWGNVETQSVNITVLPLIDDETVTATATNLCSNGSTTITTGASTSGVSYYLRDDADNSVVAGPFVGTGNGISFNTGTISSNTTYNVYADIPAPTPPAPSYALDLDGTNDYINAPINPSFNYEQGFTFEAKLKLATGGSRAIFSAGTASTSDIEIYVQDGNNRMTVVYNRASPGYTLGYKEYNIGPVNTWFHLAVTYDGTNTKLYYDGVEQFSIGGSTGSPLHKTTGAEFDFGFMRSNINNNWGFVNHQGSFDEIRLWNDARTTGEIQSMMSECSDGSQTGLVALFPLDNGSGVVATDVVGGYNGTLVNMDANDWVAPQASCSSGAASSSAVDLDGTNDYINVPVPSYFDYSQGFTFEARLKANAGGSRAILSAGTTTTSDIEVYVQAGTNKLTVVYNRNSPGNAIAAYEYAVPPLNSWFELAITYDGVTTKTYINGVAQTPLSTTTGSPLYQSAGAQFDFGYMRSTVTTGAGFATHLGAFDEIRLWDNARSAGDILADVNTCSDGTGEGLVSVYPFNEGSGLVANDIVGGHNGTLINMVSASDWVDGAFACSVAGNPSCTLEMTQTVTITVGDAIAPVADVASLTAINAQCEVTTLTAPMATDNCAGAVTGTHNASLPISSNTTITWTYDDGNGNSVTQDQEVVISDNTAPVPDAVSLHELSAVCEITVLTPPTATDNCDGSLIATHNATLPLTSNGMITWTWTDGDLNSVTQMQDVVITDIDVATTVNGGTITADQAGATYQWVDCDNGNAAIADEDGQSFAPASSGNYAVEVTLNGCTETSGCVNMMVTGIIEAHAAELKIFPIPVTQLLNVVCSEDVQALHVYAVSGQLLATYAQNTKAIDVSMLSNGMYLLVVQIESGQMQRRFVKE
ncbi:MAG: T9SS type A sorting domain-containing protein [Flavobacteriales bacterium]|nr:T9SS type A sorting domain-containing protein [Flavobacteriales bacterium]